MIDDDTAPIRKLWSRRFGGAPERQNKWLRAALDPAHSVAGHVAVLASREEIVGFGLLDVGSRAYTRQYLGLDELDLSLPLGDRNGILHMYCVRADWEGYGIGSALYGRHLRVLAERNVPRGVGISWHRPDAERDSRMLFEKWGFRATATVERYYERTSPRKRCPACGGACSCTATLYTRRIEPSNERKDEDLHHS